MIPSAMRWSDLGSFESVYDALDKDSDGNVVLRHDGVAGSFINVGSGNNFIYSESKKVAGIDISGLIIVDTRDALLVGLKSSSQKVKDIVEVLKREGSLLKDYHVTEYRPWGSYTTLESGHHYKMRVMTVKPGRKLGSHKHFHRNEHWIVVNGTAEIEIGAQANAKRTGCADASADEAKEEVRMVCENQSTYIPAGLMHRIGNPGRMPLVMVEVQSGDYLEEDDILRIDE
jgi:mannose-1-phosphate guanylyltransferase/mannose-6-phosphate isomerase